METDDAVPETSEQAAPTLEARRRLGYAVWGVAGVAAAALFLYGVLAGSGFLGLGAASSTRAPEFRARVISPAGAGEELRLSDLRGQPVVLNFWASWCGPCRAEMPAFERVADRYRERGLVVVGMTVQDEEGAALSFLRELGISYTVGMDDDGTISRAYGVTGLPATYFITDTGMKARAWVGAIPEDRLESMALDLLR